MTVHVPVFFTTPTAAKVRTSVLVTVLAGVSSALTKVSLFAGLALVATTFDGDGGREGLEIARKFDRIERGQCHCRATSVANGAELNLWSRGRHIGREVMDRSVIDWR
jgi:hypothetical protein